MREQDSSTSAPYITPHHSDAWKADAARQGKAGSQTLLGVERGRMSQEVRDRLELDDTAAAVVRRRLILADGQPVELADSYYPANLVDGTPIAGNAKIKGGAVRVLVGLGHGIDTADEQITARRPDPEEADLLGIPADEPLIVLARVSRDTAGTPVEYAVNRMVAARTEPLSYRTRNGAQ
jgi:DNA-binding GntR family transcriptional regulator